MSQFDLVRYDPLSRLLTFPGTARAREQPEHRASDAAASPTVSSKRTSARVAPTSASPVVAGRRAVFPRAATSPGARAPGSPILSYSPTPGSPTLLQGPPVCPCLSLHMNRTYFTVI